MRVNIYAEEITQRIEIIEKTTRDGRFTGVRFYLELPVTVPNASGGVDQIAGPFKHHDDDDDSSAVTFWGKGDARDAFMKAINALNEYYAQRQMNRGKPGAPPA